MPLASTFKLFILTSFLCIVHGLTSSLEAVGTAFTLQSPLSVPLFTRKMCIRDSDTTASDSGLVVNVTAIGRIADSHIKRRSDARPGDLIAVGGSLGESGAGLRDILAGRYDTPLAQIHRNPAPQVAEGIWLGERPEVHAMMDISDGIASDLRHILHRSGVGAEVDTCLLYTSRCV